MGELLHLRQGLGGARVGQNRVVGWTRWPSRAVLVRRRRRMAAALVADGQLRADLLERDVLPYLAGRRRPRCPDRSSRRTGNTR